MKIGRRAVRVWRVLIGNVEGWTAYCQCCRLHVSIPHHTTHADALGQAVAHAFGHPASDGG